MAENENKTAEVIIAVIIIVASYMYIHTQLVSKSMLDVILAVLVFGFGLILLYKHVK